MLTYIIIPTEEVFSTIMIGKALTVKIAVGLIPICSTLKTRLLQALAAAGEFID